MRKTLILPVLFFLLVIFSNRTESWGCTTHQYICDQAGHPELDCCLADVTQTPPAYYHHCENNATDCNARVKAEEFWQQGRPEIAAHLWADAWSVVHWKSVTCHSEFEKKVDEFVKNIQQGKQNPLYGVTIIDCIDKKTGANVTPYINGAYLNDTIADLKGRMNRPIPASTTLLQPQSDPLAALLEGLNYLIQNILRSLGLNY